MALPRVRPDGPGLHPPQDARITARASPGVQSGAPGRTASQRPVRPAPRWQAGLQPFLPLPPPSALTRQCVGWPGQPGPVPGHPTQDNAGWDRPRLGSPRLGSSKWRSRARGAARFRMAPAVAPVPPRPAVPGRDAHPVRARPCGPPPPCVPWTARRRKVPPGCGPPSPRRPVPCRVRQAGPAQAGVAVAVLATMGQVRRAARGCGARPFAAPGCPWTRARTRAT